MDWVFLVLLLSFTIRGILRGTVAQVFAFFGVLLGLWAGACVSAWIGEHWRDARPALLYLALRWIVSALAGLSVATLVDWLGEKLAKTVREGPLGGVDRLVGGALGLAHGAVLVMVISLLVLLVPALGFARKAAVKGMLARPSVATGARLTRWRNGPVPGTRWLHAQFEKAESRFTSSRSI